MAKSKVVSKVVSDESEKEGQISHFSYIMIFKKHKNLIYTIMSAICILAIICIFYTQSKSISLIDAWNQFSVFQKYQLTNSNISNDKIEDVKKTIENTAAEPLFLFYLTNYYFSNRDFIQGRECLSLLKTKYKNHYIAKNSHLLPKLISFNQSEKEWESSF